MALSASLPSVERECHSLDGDAVASGNVSDEKMEKSKKVLAMCDYCELVFNNKKIIDMEAGIMGYSGESVSFHCGASIAYGENLCLYVNRFQKKRNNKDSQYKLLPYVRKKT